MIGTKIFHTLLYPIQTFWSTWALGILPYFYINISFTDIREVFVCLLLPSKHNFRLPVCKRNRRWFGFISEVKRCVTANIKWKAIYFVPKLINAHVYVVLGGFVPLLLLGLIFTSIFCIFTLFLCVNVLFAVVLCLQTSLPQLSLWGKLLSILN